MTYYADLTPYAYDEHDQPMVNIGWLDRSQPFPTGSVDLETYGRMVRLASFRRAVMRGWHDCPFCEEESPILLQSGTGDDVVHLGHSEIRVEGNDGRVYAAPTLVCHYVSAHAYLPPQEFLEAVRTGSVGPPESAELPTAFIPQLVARTAVSFPGFR